MSESMSSFFEGLEFVDPSFSNHPASPDNLFSIFDALEGLQEGEETVKEGLLFQGLSETEVEVEVSQQSKRKRAKIIHVQDDNEETRSVGVGADGDGDGDGDGGEGSKMSHIAVERNRRKQMNQHISVLRSLMPCFYVKRGDQASIIGGVVDYISELQQVLQSLEAKKQRKAYSHEVLSPRVIISSPIPSQVLSPRKPPLSPRLNNNLPLSPRTPQPNSPYNIRPRTNLSSTLITPIDLSPSSSCSSLNDCLANELIANSKSTVAEVEVKFSGPNLLLKTISQKIPGQVVKIVSLLEDLSLEILQISISTFEDMMLNSFTIKIGIECQLSAEELAHQIQQTFCSSPFIN